MRYSLFYILGVLVFLSSSNIQAQSREAAIQEADRIANLLQSMYSDPRPSVENSDRSSELLVFNESQTSAKAAQAEFTINPFRNSKLHAQVETSYIFSGFATFVAMTFGAQMLERDISTSTSLALGSAVFVTSLLSGPAIFLLPDLISQFREAQKLKREQRKIENVFWDRLKLRGFNVPNKQKLRAAWLQSLFTGKITDEFLKTSPNFRKDYLSLIRDKIGEIYSSLLAVGLNKQDPFLKKLKVLKKEASLAFVFGSSDSMIKTIRSVETQLAEMIIGDGQYGSEVRDLMKPEVAKNWLNVFAPPNIILPPVESSFCRTHISRVGGASQGDETRFVSAGAALINQ